MSRSGIQNSDDATVSPVNSGFAMPITLNGWPANSMRLPMASGAPFNSRFQPVSLSTTTASSPGCSVRPRCACTPSRSK